MVCTSKDANIFQCADAALKTAVSNVQRDVTELRTDVSELKAYSRHCNETGELSEMKKIELQPAAHVIKCTAHV